jgi:beta-1,4-mannosyltransferase
MFKIMFRYSDVIITHSQEGIRFAGVHYPLYSNKIRYFIHPVIPFHPTDTVIKPEYDFFLWGTIWPYKGITEFLRFLKSSGNSHLKILIAGICINETMRTDLISELYENVHYINHFHDLDEIARLARKARFTVFTYRAESVLSSGSLMDSIGNGSIIIGPDTGAFNDLSSNGFIRTYKTFPDIIEIQNTYKPDLEKISSERSGFLQENSWDMFGSRLCKALIENLGLS